MGNVPCFKLTLCQHWSDHQAGPDQELFVNGVRLIVLWDSKKSGRVTVAAGVPSVVGARCAS